MSGSAVRSSRTRRALTLALAVALAGGLAGIPALSGQARATTVTGNLLAGDTVALTSYIGSWTGTNLLSLKTRIWSDGTGSLAITAKAPGTAVVQTGLRAV